MKTHLSADVGDVFWIIIENPLNCVYEHINYTIQRGLFVRTSISTNAHKSICFMIMLYLAIAVVAVTTA